MFESSLILNDGEDLSLSKMFNFKKETLLYRATRDGFNAAAFHNKCNGRRNTVTLIKTDSNDVFGGFTSAAWNSSYTYIADAKAFVFSLRRNGTSNNEKFMIKPSNSNTALIGNPKHGPIFGGGNGNAINKSCNYCRNYYGNCNCVSGYDYITYNGYETGCEIFIKDNSNVNHGSEANIGDSYQLPYNLAKTKKEWLTTEIEVFELTK